MCNGVPASGGGSGTAGTAAGTAKSQCPYDFFGEGTRVPGINIYIYIFRIWCSLDSRFIRIALGLRKMAGTAGTAGTGPVFTGEMATPQRGLVPASAPVLAPERAGQPCRRHFCPAPTVGARCLHEPSEDSLLHEGSSRSHESARFRRQSSKPLRQGGGRAAGSPGRDWPCHTFTATGPRSRPRKSQNPAILGRLQTTVCAYE